MSCYCRRELQRTHQLPLGLGRLSSAKVAQRPGRVPQHAELVVLGQEREQRVERARLENVVSALGRVTGNVSERPHAIVSRVRNGIGRSLRLFPDIEDVGGEELDEEGDGAMGDDDLGVLGRARGDV